MRTPTLAATAALVALLSLPAARAHAGCGCDKPPPPLAAIRPAFASPGGTVTLFAPGLQKNQLYSVTFTNGTSTATVSGTATLRRDFADAVVKPQVVVRAPALPPGPTSVVLRSRTRTLSRIPADAFTMLQAPLALLEANGETTASCYRAAVGADGRVYIPLDITAIVQHMIFDGFGARFPLKFKAEDVTIYNTQGVLMQLLGPDNTAIYEIADDEGRGNSFSLTYDRHEFMTYRSQHIHEGKLALDRSDPAWHVDGTRHIDHDHLVIAIRGQMKTTGAPAARGATAPFDLHVTTALDGGRSVMARNIAWGSCATPVSSFPRAY